MTHEERRERRQTIVERLRDGETITAICREYGLSFSYVAGLQTNWERLLRGGKGTSGLRTYTEAQQRRNDMTATMKFRRWVREHLRKCDDLAGQCCAYCHENDLLTFEDMKNGDVAHVCCAKAERQRPI